MVQRPQEWSGWVFPPLRPHFQDCWHLRSLPKGNRIPSYPTVLAHAHAKRKGEKLVPFLSVRSQLRILGFCRNVSKVSVLRWRKGCPSQDIGSTFKAAATSDPLVMGYPLHGCQQRWDWGEIWHETSSPSTPEAARRCDSTSGHDLPATIIPSQNPKTF